MESSDRSGLETDPAEHLDVLLNKYANIWNKNQDTKEIDASMT